VSEPTGAETLDGAKPDLRKHAEWMVSSGQFRGTVEQYLSFLHVEPDPIPEPTTEDQVREVMQRTLDAYYQPYLAGPELLNAILTDLAAAGLTITPAEVAASDGVTVSYNDLKLAVLAFDIVDFDPKPDWLDRLDTALRSSAPATTERE
jgi:hypothetical protein